MMKFIKFYWKYKNDQNTIFDILQINWLKNTLNIKIFILSILTEYSSLERLKNPMYLSF